MAKLKVQKEKQWFRKHRQLKIGQHELEKKQNGMNSATMEG